MIVYLFIHCTFTWADSGKMGVLRTFLFSHQRHMGQYQLLSVLAARLSPLNIDHSRNLPVEIFGINYTEMYTNL